MRNRFPIPNLARAIAGIAAACILAAPASLTAAEPSVCDTCVDGPEMIQHVEPNASSAQIDAIKVIDSETTECNIGAIVRTYGNQDWLVAECNDGMLLFSQGPNNRTPHVFLFRPGADGNPIVFEQPVDKRAKAAYEELKSLTAEQVAALVRDIRASTKD